jgi:hypothetical protein
MPAPIMRPPGKRLEILAAQGEESVEELDPEAEADGDDSPAAPFYRSGKQLFVAERYEDAQVEFETCEDVLVEEGEDANAYRNLKFYTKQCVRMLKREDKQLEAQRKRLEKQSLYSSGDDTPTHTPERPKKPVLPDSPLKGSGSAPEGWWHDRPKCGKDGVRNTVYLAAGIDDDDRTLVFGDFKADGDKTAVRPRGSNARARTLPLSRLDMTFLRLHSTCSCRRRYRSPTEARCSSPAA